ncbi:MAG: pitrilysin family protein [Patescibacteria group bacterium]
MFKQYALPNKLKVLLAPMKETKAVTALVLVKVGSRYETRDINGVSHFVEHLMFKGTPRRPNTQIISQELDGIGAEYNAFTTKDHTGYYIRAAVEHLPLLLDMLSDMLYNSIFDAGEMEKERGVIVEEINMYEDNPLMYMEDLFEETMYEDCPLGWNIAGPREVIRTITRDKLVNYYRRHYQPANMLLVLAGNIPGTARALIKKYFNTAQPTKFTPAKFDTAPGEQKRTHTQVKEKATEQVQMALGFPAYSLFDKRVYPLSLLAVILGGNMSSRLFINIRERQGLCYFIRASVNAYEDTGNLMVQAGLDKKRIKEAITAILHELTSARDNGLSAKELRKAKEYMKGKLILDLESSENVASWIGKQELLRKKVISPSEQIRRVERVTLKDIAVVAHDLLQTSRISLSLIGPYKDPAEFAALLKL